MRNWIDSLQGKERYRSVLVNEALRRILKAMKLVVI